MDVTQQNHGLHYCIILYINHGRPHYICIRMLIFLCDIIQIWDILGCVSIKRCQLSSIGISVLKIRRSRDRLIFNMGIPISGKDGLFIYTVPCFHLHSQGNISLRQIATSGSTRIGTKQPQWKSHTEVTFKRKSATDSGILGTLVAPNIGYQEILCKYGCHISLINQP